MVGLSDSINNDTAVQFRVKGKDPMFLPEQYNGLGYQNLISMVFNLIRFRDEWMKIGKVAKTLDSKDRPIELVHLVLVEEPEAYLHAQVQQVFIKKAYHVLRNRARLTSSSEFKTQMVVSTHSSHIAHELDFSCLRYFRREPATQKGETPIATVINLTETFGDSNETSKFVTRYIRTTHCELFFADAAILVEGSSERMLVPHFIREKFAKLHQSYISILEVGGAHAHRLRPLLDTLGLVTLIVTDLDSIAKDKQSKVCPKRGQGYRTGNVTLKSWVPRRESLDELLALPDDEKQTDKLIRVAYQCPISVAYTSNEGQAEAIPYTFEDALALSNIELFREFESPSGLLKKLQNALGKDSLEDASKKMFCSLNNSQKAEMALELLFRSDPEQIEPPHYIAHGLRWLERMLEKRASTTF